MSPPIKMSDEQNDDTGDQADTGCNVHDDPTHATGPRPTSQALPGET